MQCPEPEISFGSEVIEINHTFRGEKAKLLDQVEKESKEGHRLFKQMTNAEDVLLIQQQLDAIKIRIDQILDELKINLQSNYVDDKEKEEVITTISQLSMLNATIHSLIIGKKLENPPIELFSVISKTAQLVTFASTLHVKHYVSHDHKL